MLFLIISYAILAMNEKINFQLRNMIENNRTCAREMDVWTTTQTALENEKLSINPLGLAQKGQTQFTA